MLKTHHALVTRVQDDPLLRDRAARSQPAWIPHEVLEEAWNFGVPRMDYRRMVEKLSALHGVATAIEVEQEKAATAGMREQPAETADLATTREDTVLEALVTPAQAKAITALINQFKRPGTGGLRQRVNPGLDEWGRAYAPGYRRRVKAHVWVVASSEPGNGRVMIDGEDMTDVLERVVDRARVMAPFEVTDTVGRFNVWCELEVARKDVKPGPTGISGALANGIANALLLHNAGFESWLEEGRLF